MFAGSNNKDREPARAISQRKAETLTRPIVERIEEKFRGQIQTMVQKSQTELRTDDTDLIEGMLEKLRKRRVLQSQSALLRKTCKKLNLLFCFDR
jgi:hypothetical protein